MKVLNLRQKDIAKRALAGNEEIEDAEYRQRELPRGDVASVIYVKIAGRWRATNMASLYGRDIWLDTLYSFLNYEELNPSEARAYELTHS